ncbi:uncharacterized protein ddias [Cheilinus undulatus]|uniref:uncharacterized protein ddias n=1 Tax=Cheilinus undulatus TaxID=241271 RepID=UPI001BD2BD18|nr:uncharacterized protein ddias [Cheilinus undulatus]
MSVRPALVDCVVLSLQDSCVFYPSCKGCFSRIQVELKNTTRCRCSKCGYVCLRENVDYRYRLSLKVTRETCIFGVTVFGTCLNPFFGIHATGLQRLLNNMEGPVEASTRSTLLVTAVQDCFIGRRFIFGIKVTETEPEPWLRRPIVNSSSSRETVQLIASQMILPKALGLAGCTVVSYYEILLQKASEYEQGSTDLHKPSRPPETPLLLCLHPSPPSSFDSTSPSTASCISLPLQRSQYQDCTLTPTPPWQQSLGLITSSAEQEESCNSQDRGEDRLRQTNKKNTQNQTERDNLKHLKIAEERGSSPLRSLQCHSCSSPSFAKYSSVNEAAGQTSIQESLFSLSPSNNNNNSSSKRRCSLRNLTKTHLSDSLAWENLPFSESLTEFLGEENKDCINVSESKADLNVQNQEETTKNSLELGSQDKNLSVESESVCQSFTQKKVNTFMDLIDTPGLSEADSLDLSEQVCKEPAECVNKSQVGTILLQEDEKSFPSFLESEEEQLQGDVYDCSADLFSSPPMMDKNTSMLKTNTETVRVTTEACTELYMPKKQCLRREMTDLTPVRQKLKSNICSNDDNFLPPGTLDLDFVPPSQSTPIVKLVALTGTPDPSYRTSTFGEFISQTHSQDFSSHFRNQSELGSKIKTKIPSYKSEGVGVNQVHQCGDESTKENLERSTTFSRYRFNSKRRFVKHKNRLRDQRWAPDTGSPGRQKHSCNHDVALCDNDNSLFVPPTPVAKSLLSEKQRKGQTEYSSSSSSQTYGELLRDRRDCKISLMDQTVKSTQRGLVQTGNADSETLDKGAMDGSDSENGACDWSRDLFSDSV